MKKRVSRLIKIPVRYVLYLLVLLIILFPIYWIASMSLKTFADIISFPPVFIFTPTLENFHSIFAQTPSAGEMPSFIRYVLNSCIISGGAVILALLLGLPAAYALTRSNSKANRRAAFTFMSYRFAPELMVILPLFRIFMSLGLYDTYRGMILIHQLVTLPLVVWIMMGAFREIPRELENAAKIDGANPWQTFAQIMLPIAKPGIASATIIAFIFSWNNLLFGLILSGGRTRAATMGILQTMTFDQILWGQMAAFAMVAAIPGIIIAIFCQRFLVKGLAMGAIK